MAGGAITFAGGGELKLDQSTGFTGQIAGFAVPDELDLADISFGSGTMLSFTEAASNTSGTLTVTDGTHVANLTFLGSYTTAQFHIANDGSGQVLVTDPPVAASTNLLWQSTPDAAVASTPPMASPSMSDLSPTLLTRQSNDASWLAAQHPGA